MRYVSLLMVVFLAACATPQQERAATRGALIGAAAGAAIGAPHHRAAEGALVGGAIGAAAGAILSEPDAVSSPRRAAPRYRNTPQRVAHPMHRGGSSHRHGDEESDDGGDDGEGD